MPKFSASSLVGLVVCSLIMPSLSYRCFWNNLHDKIFPETSGEAQPDSPFISPVRPQPNNGVPRVNDKPVDPPVPVLHVPRNDGSMNRMKNKIEAIRDSIDKLKLENRREVTSLAEEVTYNRAYLCFSVALCFFGFVFIIRRITKQQKKLKQMVKEEVGAQLINKVVFQPVDEMEDEIRLKNDSCAEFPVQDTLVQAAQSNPEKLHSVEEILGHLQKIADEAKNSATCTEDRIKLVTPGFLEKLALDIYNAPSINVDIKYITPDLLCNVASFCKAMDDVISSHQPNPNMGHTLPSVNFFFTMNNGDEEMPS